MIDVVKWDANEDELVWKFPSNDLSLGTQLIVKTAQTAIFVKDGKIFDLFEPGSYTLKSNNIPLLNKIINLPFTGDSPFQAEVWFIQRIKKLDNGWGTSVPIQLEDPKYQIVVPIRAFGQFGFTISNPKLFLEEIVGTAKVYSAEKIVRYFKGKIISAVTTLIAKKIIHDKISILDIPSHLEDLSLYCENRISDEFNRFGLDVVNFFFESISMPEDDPSVIQLKSAKATAAAASIIGTDLYKFNRTMDVFEKGTQNTGTVGDTMNAGLGFGLGATMANTISKFGNQEIGIKSSNDPVVPPPLEGFFIALDNQSKGPFSISEIKELITTGIINKETLIWKKGLSDWVKAESDGAINELFSETPPPLTKQ